MTAAMTPTGQAAAERILALLHSQRDLLGRTDPDSAIELDRICADLEQALAALAAQLRAVDRAGPRGMVRPDPGTVDAVRRQLKANQAMLARYADVNRRALHILFGEPTLYGR